MEADDLIASAARKLAALGYKVIVVSGDKDLLQLVGDDILCWEPMKDVVMDSEGVKKKYNVGPDRLLDLFALMGDKSDNVPGVPGIGPKSAEKLINEFGSLDELYKNIDSLKKSKMKENLEAHREDAFMSRELIDLKEDLDISENINDYRLPEPDRDKLKELYTELEFTRLMKAEIPAVSSQPGRVFPGADRRGTCRSGEVVGKSRFHGAGHRDLWSRSVFLPSWLDCQSV